MRNIFFGIVIGLIIVFGLRYCEHKKDEKETLQVNTNLIEKQLQNVGKLVVTEGNYAQVFSYEDSKKYYIDLLSSTKKALVIVNAEASVSYDLSKITTEIDETNRTLTITNVPEPELSINPNIEYYDIDNGYFNQFEASDYNIIKKRVNDSLHRTIVASQLMTNAENRLISELQKIYVLTSSMGWTLHYQERKIADEKDLEYIKL